MQMREHVFGEAPRCILPDSFEHDITHIVEKYSAKPRSGIGSDQSNRDGRARFHPRRHPVNRLTIEPTHRELHQFRNQH